MIFKILLRQEEIYKPLICQGKRVKWTNYISQSFHCYLFKVCLKHLYQSFFKWQKMK